ncbi:hypothetical protein AOLI_G00010480 [Acnodon oligacanthus]
MEVIFVTLMLSHLFCCVEVTPVTAAEAQLTYTIKTPGIRIIRTGDTVDLCCDKNHRVKTMWYGQKYNRAPFIILSAEMTSGHKECPSVKFYWGYSSRINVTWIPTNNSICLTLKNINESDEGFYFCTVGDGVLTTPGTGHILKLEEPFKASTQTPMSTTGQVNSSGESWQCGIVWTLVSVVFSLSILLTALVLLIIQKKRGTCTGTSQTGQRVRQVEKLEETEVQYSTLYFSNPK